MNIHIVSSFARSVGLVWKKYQAEAEQCFVVASPISNTTIPLYEWITDHAKEFRNWDNTYFLMMDEQVIVTKTKRFAYIAQDNPASFEKKIQEMFLNRLEKKTKACLSEAIIKPNIQELPLLTKRKKKSVLLDEKLVEHGGIDLLILAIGEEGHYAQVAPGTPKEVGFHISTLLESYKEKHKKSGTFLGAEFQKYGMSLGPKQVVTAKHIVVIISGEEKRKLTKELFSYKKFDPEFPFSIIYEPEVKERVDLFITKDVVDKKLEAQLKRLVTSNPSA